MHSAVRARPRIQYDLSDFRTTAFRTLANPTSAANTTANLRLIKGVNPHILGKKQTSLAARSLSRP